MVLRNVAKTFSLEEQRQEINEIAIDLDAVNTTLTNWNASQWDTAYSWGDHAQAGYLVATSASYNNANWDTAYGWGDHAQGGYLTAYQTDAQIKTSYEANADTNAFTDALLTKLNGIETGATADQTGAEIKTAYEGEADTNAFTDTLLTKLNGIADGAEVNLDPGGTYAGTGTAQDPAIGSIQFKNFGNIFGGDSTFVYNNTENKLGIGVAAPKNELHILRGVDGGDVSLRITNQSSVDAGTSASMYLGTSPSDTFNTFYIRAFRDGGATHLGYSDPDAANHDPNIILPSAGGLEFGTQTDTAASGSAKTSATLDHYEEGTWTPGAGSNFTGSFTNAEGYYTRIGNMVFATFQFNYSGLTDSGSNSQVTGLPFDVADRHTGTGIEATNSVYASNGIYLAWAEGGQGSMYIATSSPLSGTASTGGDFIRGSLTYPVA